MSAAAYVGIDQSLSNTGIAAVLEDGTIVRVESLIPAEQGPRRLANLQTLVASFLSDVEDEHDIGGVCMEGYSYGSVQGRETAGGTVAAIQLALLRHFGWGDQAAYPSYPVPSQVKKFAGNAKAKKSALAMMVLRKWGEGFEDDNQCDAYVLARIAAHLYGGAPCSLTYEREVIDKVRVRPEWTPLAETQPAKRSPGKRRRYSG